MGRFLGGWFSLRFVGRSRAILSPQRTTKTCMIEFVGLRTLSGTKPLLAKPRGARPRPRGHPALGHVRRPHRGRRGPRVSATRHVAAGALEPHQQGGDADVRQRVHGSMRTVRPARGRLEATRRSVPAGPAARRGARDGSTSSGGAPTRPVHQLVGRCGLVGLASAGAQPDRLRSRRGVVGPRPHRRLRPGHRRRDAHAVVGRHPVVGVGPPRRGVHVGPAVASWGANRLDLFGRGSTNAVLQQLGRGRLVRAWSQVSPNPIDSDPAAVSWGPNRVDVFALATDRQMATISWDGAALVVVDTAGRRVQVRALPRRRRVPAASTCTRGAWTTCCGAPLAGRGWSGWAQVAPIPIAFDPAAVCSAPGRTELFACGTDGQMYTMATVGG